MSAVHLTSFRAGEWRGVAGARAAREHGIRTLAPAHFELHWQSRTFDGVAVEHFVGTPHEHTRPFAQLGDAVELVFIESGSAVLHHHGARQLTPASVVLLPTLAQHRLECGSSCGLLRVRADRDLLQQVAPVPPTSPVTMSLRPGLISGARAFAAELLDGGHSALPPIEAYAAGQLLIEMVGSVALSHAGSGEVSKGRTADLRDEAMATIAQLRADPELSVAELASRLNVSPRRLQEAFTEAGTTVSAEIRNQRALLAETLLTTPKFDVLSIDEIARNSGFGTAVTLRRALAELRGVTPSQLRRRELS